MAPLHIVRKHLYNRFVYVVTNVGVVDDVLKMVM